MEPEPTSEHTTLKPPSLPPPPPPPPPRIFYPAGDSNQSSVAFIEIPSSHHDVRSSAHQNRRARAKSGLAGLFVLMDLIYLIVILTVAIPGMLYFLFDVTLDELGEIVQLSNMTYCGRIDLARQVEWIGFASLIVYLLAVVSLITSVITFASLAVHGYDCHAWMFYFRLGIFIVVHLPIQTLGFKVSIKFIRSIVHRPSYMIYEPSTALDLHLRRHSSPSHISRRNSSLIKKTHSARRIATVDD